MTIPDPDESEVLMVELLRAVAEADEYHVGFAEGSAESRKLRNMAGADLIRWCPYPEECYILTPYGRALLDGLSAR